MARQARKRSTTGIYHVMLRGIDKRNVFLHDNDKMVFMKKLLRAKENANFGLYGYCLMDNHIHLLIHESEEIGISIKRITVGYVSWHNNTYGRVGHLFQNRYLSEPIESEGYLVHVLRYIHQNPLKANMVEKPKDYPWSSYNDYISTYQGNEINIDADMIMTYFKEQKDFEEFTNTQNDDKFVDFEPEEKFTDGALEDIIKIKIASDFLNEESIEDRKRLIKDIYNSTGVSIRQLGRVFGVDKNVIARAVKEDKGNVPLYRKKGL